MRNFIKNTVYMFMFMMILFGINLVFELEADGLKEFMNEPLYSRVSAILMLSILMVLYMRLINIADDIYNRKLLKRLNEFARGVTNLSGKRGALNRSYLKIYEMYRLTPSDQHDMYNYLLSCIRYTKICLKTTSLFKQITSKLEYFEMYNRLNNMLDLLIKYDRESYLSWYQTKEETK